MTDRPYEGFSDSELRDQEQRFDKWMDELRKEDDRFWNERIVSDRTWETNEDYQSILEHKRQIGEQRRKLYEEIQIRRDIRVQESRARQEQMQQAKDRPPLVPMACACRPPRRIRLTKQVSEGGPVLCGVCHQPFQPT